MTGWNLPPGCSNADIERACGGPDVEPTYSIETVCDNARELESVEPCESLDDARSELARRCRHFTRHGWTLVKMTCDDAVLVRGDEYELTIKIVEVCDE